MINTITIMGRLVKDPELRTTTSGVEVAAFTVAVDRPYKSNGETITDFIKCKAWKQTAAFVGQYFAKGRMIALTGSLQSRNYEDKNGNKRIDWEVVADYVAFCGDKATERGKTEPSVYGAVGQPEFDVAVDDDLPW